MTPAERKSQARLTSVLFNKDEVLSHVVLMLGRDSFRTLRDLVGTVPAQLIDGVWMARVSPENCREIQARIDHCYRSTEGVIEDCDVYPLWAAIAPVSHMFEEPV